MLYCASRTKIVCHRTMCGASRRGARPTPSHSRSCVLLNDRPSSVEGMAVDTCHSVSVFGQECVHTEESKREKCCIWWTIKKLSDCMSKQLNAVWRMDVHPDIKQDKWRKIIFLVVEKNPSHFFFLILIGEDFLLRIFYSLFLKYTFIIRNEFQSKFILNMYCSLNTIMVCLNKYYIYVVFCFFFLNHLLNYLIATSIGLLVGKMKA